MAGMMGGQAMDMAGMMNNPMMAQMMDAMLADPQVRLTQT